TGIHWASREPSGPIPETIAAPYCRVLLPLLPPECRLGRLDAGRLNQTRPAIDLDRLEFREVLRRAGNRSPALGAELFLGLVRLHGANDDLIEAAYDFRRRAIKAESSDPARDFIAFHPLLRDR